MLGQGGSSTGIAAAREGVAALKSYGWLVVLLAVAGLVVGYLASPPNEDAEYRAWVTSEALAANRSVTETGISTPPGPQAADFLGDGIVARIRAATGESYDWVIEHLDIEQPPNGGPNPPIALVATAESPADARALLGLWLRAIRAARMHYVSGVLARGERGLRKSLDRAVNRNQPTTERAIVELLARMQTLRATLSIDYSISGKPRPLDKATASRARGTLKGGIAGGIVGVALALLLPLLGGRLRTADGVSAALGVELLADLRSPGGIPSPEHARERLRAIASGSLPGELQLQPCGVVGSDMAVEVADALGEGFEVKVNSPLGTEGLLEELKRSRAWVVVASPGALRRGEAAAFRAELDGVGAEPVGLFVV